MTDRSTRRRGGGLPRNSAEDATVVTADPRPDQPAYEPVEGGDVDLHRHFGTPAHAHAHDAPHWHDGDQTFPLHDYPAADDAALYGSDSNPDNPAPYERPELDGPHPIPPANDPGMQLVDALLGASGTPQSTEEEVDPPPPEAGRARLRAELRSSLNYLDTTEPARPPAPVREGVSRAGTSIAHPGALSLLNSIHGITDDALNHEMTWHAILTPLVVEMATYHADQRPQGGSGPELAPLELVMRARDAMEHIIQARLQPRESGRG